jgi:formate-dependent nitrite reductase cytochrome c552 subunit
MSKTGRRIVATTGLIAVTVTAWLALADNQPASTPAATSSSIRSNLFPVTIRQPAGPPRVNTGLTNYHGQPVFAACSSCHASTQPNLETHRSAELDQFHQGLKYAHGNLACLSCHNAKNYDTLHLANGQPVEFTRVMTLCAQCHGTAMRDYERGSHGGMNGHWDLNQGPRTRNNCVNCHDPHAPKYPQARPVFPPRDRITVEPKPGAKGTH